METTAGNEQVKGTTAIEVEPGSVLSTSQECHPILVPVSVMFEEAIPVEPPQVQEGMEVETQVIQVEVLQQEIVQEEVATQPIHEMEMEIVGEVITGDNMEEPVDEDGDTCHEVSSLVLPMATKLTEDKRYKCTNTGCDAEYNSLEHLHRHLSRGHLNEMQLPVWGHSIFGLTELKMETGDEGESMLCMFCCNSYQHNKEIDKERKSVLANDPGFTRFCEAALRQQRKRMSANGIIKSLNSLRKLSVCQRCFNKIGYAMGTKMAADEVESRVETLRRQLDTELKNLQSEVEQFHSEMKTIEGVIKNSDRTCLEDYLKGIEGLEEKERSSVVLLLREGIFGVMEEVEGYCRRVKGQQIVVKKQKVRRRTGGKGRKMKRGRGRKDKGIYSMVEQEKEEDEVDGGKREVDTPRRLPKRKARVKTEEFLRSLFEKQEVEKELGQVENDKAGGEEEDGEVKKNEENDKVGGEENEGKEKLSIEEILIEGDDDLDDLVYEVTSDEDFLIDDLADDDFDSGSLFSSCEDEENDEVDDSAEDDEPKPKRGRGRPKKNDLDPFNFKKKSGAGKPLSNKKLAQMHNIDMSHMSNFRKRLVCRILKKNAIPPTDPLISGAPDPRVNYRFEYDFTSDRLFLGPLNVLILDNQNSLQCSKCGYLSSSADKPRRSVSRLMYNHILGKHLHAFQCPYCHATLGTYRRYLDHIKGHQMGFQCEICGKPLFSEEALKRHKWGHMNADEIAEAVKQGIKDPRKKHDPSQSFQCTVCGKVFGKKMLLRQHEKTHEKNRERIVCTLCGKTFLPSGFISHRKYSCFPEGYEPPRVQCQLCPSTFKSGVLRARHMKYAHSSASVEKPFKCDICGKGFAAKEHVQKHIKRHSDARPYLCRMGCGANYKTRKDCSRHEKKCEGSGTPMMRHRERNDSLSARPSQVIKLEPGTTDTHSETVMITSVQDHTDVDQVTPPPIMVQTITQTEASPAPAAQTTPQLFNVYNIL